jgi:hypothetical protein
LRALSFVFLVPDNFAQRFTQCRSCPIADMTAASEAKTPTEASNGQFGAVPFSPGMRVLAAVNLNASIDMFFNGGVLCLLIFLQRPSSFFGSAPSGGRAKAL